MQGVDFCGQEWYNLSTSDIDEYFFWGSIMDFLYSLPGAIVIVYVAVTVALVCSIFNIEKLLKRIAAQTDEIAEIKNYLRDNIKKDNQD